MNRKLFVLANDDEFIKNSFADISKSLSFELPNSKFKFSYKVACNIHYVFNKYTIHNVGIFEGKVREFYGNKYGPKKTHTWCQYKDFIIDPIKYPRRHKHYPDDSINNRYINNYINNGELDQDWTYFLVYELTDCDTAMWYYECTNINRDMKWKLGFNKEQKQELYIKELGFYNAYKSLFNSDIIGDYCYDQIMIIRDIISENGYDIDYIKSNIGLYEEKYKEFISNKYDELIK